MKNFFINAGEFLLLALIIGLISYLIVSSYKKRKALNDKILRTKQELSNLDSEISKFIVTSNPIFNDDEILSGLKKSVEELSKIKIRNENSLLAISKQLNEYESELSDIKRTESNIVKVKSTIDQMIRELKGKDNVPTQMNDVANTCLGIMSDIQFDKINLDQETISKYQKLLSRVESYYNQYREMDKQFQMIKSNVEGFETVKSNLLSKLSKAKGYTQKVIEMGYDTTSVDVKEGDIESLKNFVDQIGSIYMTDLSQGMQLLKRYAGVVHGYGMETEKPIQKFNDIMQAKKFVDGDNKEIENRLNKIKNHISNDFLENGQLREAESLIAKYNMDKGPGNHQKEDPYNEESWEDNIPMKDVMRISVLLQSLLKSLDRIINIGDQAEEEYEERKRRKKEEERRRREAEEEERRRRRRREESSRSYGYGGGGSRYGGGGGGFSFGGGSTGGGGAGGSW